MKEKNKVFCGLIYLVAQNSLKGHEDILSLFNNKVFMGWKQTGGEKKARVCKSSFENLDIINICPKYWFDPYRY